ncbi:MAG: hypothetical protein H7061_05475 [Bdellovibrionaceae bacterium]|nr:hypothetical protein [Bdellovibrio sp.]
MKKQLIGLLSHSTIFLALVACSGSNGTSTGNPLVTVQFKSFSALSSQSVDQMSVSNLKMCFKRLRFKPVSGIDNNTDLFLDEVNVTTTGMLVAMVGVPVGSYSRVEFDLDTHCTSAKSIQVTNASGTFTSAQTITIRFDGLFTLSASQTLNLDIQSIISALNTAISDADVKVKAESVGGSF